MKHLKVLNFLNLWGILRKIQHSEEKCASGLVSSSGDFRRFFLTEIFQSQTKKSLKMSETDKNFDIFEFAVNYEPFFNQSVLYFFKSLLYYQFSLCWTSAILLIPKRFKKYASCTKTKMSKDSDSLGVFLKWFWSKTLQRSPHKMKCIGRSFVVELIVLEIRTKFFGTCRNCIKNDKASSFLTIQGQFEAFFSTNWGYLATKTDKNNKLAHVLGVLTI